MNGDKIKLPDFLIADLYKESLVEIDNSLNVQQDLQAVPLNEEIKAEAITDKISFIGENRKNIIIIINQPSKELSKEDMTFLLNILKACQLNITDVALINAERQKVSYAAMKEQLNAFQIILFDIEPSATGLPFKIPYFQVQDYDNCKIMTAPALSALNKTTAEGKILKTKFWNSLKVIFNIS